MIKYLRPAFFCVSLFASSCATVPPVFTYTRSYADKTFKLNQKDTIRVYVEVGKPKSNRERNIYRYLYGSLVQVLRDTRFRDNYRLSSFVADVIKRPDVTYDYVVKVDVREFGSGARVIEKKRALETSEDVRSPADCFVVPLSFTNSLDAENNYTIESNGCPGLSDIRVMAHQIFQSGLTRLFPRDGAISKQISFSNT